MRTRNGDMVFDAAETYTGSLLRKGEGWGGGTGTALSIGPQQATLPLCTLFKQEPGGGGSSIQRARFLRKEEGGRRASPSP